MTTAYRTFAQRIGYLGICVIPASLLSNEVDAEDSSSLRADASCEGLSFAKICYQLEEDIYVCRVAAAPEQVATGFTVLLTEEQLYSALPWDHRLEWEDRECSQRRCPEAILDQLRACAAKVRPLIRISPSVDEPDTCSTTTHTPTSFEAGAAQTLTVSAEDLQEALGLPQEDAAKDTATHIIQKSSYRVQQAFLRAAIDTLMAQLYQGQEKAYALTLKAKCALVAKVQRWQRLTRQQVVNAALAFDARQGMIWNVTIGIPSEVSLSA